MKIRTPASRTTVRFDSLAEGESFRIAEGANIKTDGRGGYNSVDLADGRSFNTTPDRQVFHLDAEVVEK